jgi:peptidoglycan/xylan/chitin deacetylase (PgdA/CDA1 family)
MVLPAAAADQLVQLATTTGQPAVGWKTTNRPARVLYAPEIFALDYTTRHRVLPYTSYTLPILLYHRVGSAEESKRDDRVVSATLFESQLVTLRNRGYRTVSLNDWAHAVAAQRPLDGRCVVITFDQAYADIARRAWPLLQRHGFLATIAVTTDVVGTEAGEWGAPPGTPLLDWDGLRLLRDRGAQFASHTASCSPLVLLSPEEIVREAAASRAVLERELQMPVQTLVYPDGAEDDVVQHLVSACGYNIGLTRRPARARRTDALISLPCIETRADDDLDSFLTKLDA